MYVTRRLSEYQRNRSELNQSVPEGPYSGVLIIQDKDSQPTCCFGSCYEFVLKGFPFPQNVKLTVSYSNFEDSAYRDRVFFIPVLDQPLSSNRYYVVERTAKHSGEASKNAEGEDKFPWCFCCSYVPTAKPQQPDPYDIYQRFEIHQPKRSSRSYFATSVAPNTIPPEFLTRKYWNVEYSTSEDFGLRNDAEGINTKLRSELPNDFNTSVMIGKWYVPFIFVNERNPKDQLQSTTFYSMTLHQKWEEVYSCENQNQEVVVNAEVETEVVKIEGQEISKKTTRVDENGFYWFEVAEKKIGLRYVVTKRMKWEEERFGWKRKPRREVVKKTERFNEGGSNWKSYKCYVLVESFVLQRMDQSLVFTFEFRHVDKLRTMWES